MAEQEFTTEELESEEWRDVVGYEGHYLVSNLGRVRSLARPRRTKRTGIAYVRARMMKPGMSSTGYYQITVCLHGKGRLRRIHTLVAAAFIGPMPPGHQVNHRDLCKTNNRIGNLEYATPYQNIHHAMDAGVFPGGASHGWQTKPESRLNGTRNGRAKLDNEIVLDIRKQYKDGEKMRVIARRMNIALSTVEHVVSRRTWRHI